MQFDIGIDVGGTNTDCVLCHRETEQTSPDRDLKVVRVAPKQQTTRNVTDGVVNAVRALLFEDPPVSPDTIRRVFIGTTQFLNAVVERSPELTTVGVIRLGGKGVASVLPFSTLPDTLRQRIEGAYYIIDGGFDFRGTPYFPLDINAVRAACADMKSRGIISVAICGMFSPSCPSQEDEVAKIVEEEMKSDDPNKTVFITRSRTVGQNDLILREHAAILNASLCRLARRVLKGFLVAFTELGLSHAQFFLTQNDGTVLRVHDAMQFPIRAIGSGPTNSMRGAALLARTQLPPEERDKPIFVCDIGGTTTDIGVLEKNGFPRTSNVHVVVGGVRLNCRFPDTTSLALGGGTTISFENSEASLGPSVGYKLHQQALVFGGNDLTATDIAVVASGIQIGDPAKAHARVSRDQAQVATDKFCQMLEASIAAMKTSPEDVPLLLVGGGAILIPQTITKLKGISRIYVPNHAGCANAIGAVEAEVGAEIDQIINLQGTTPEEAKKAATRELEARVLELGGVAPVNLHSLEGTPVLYLPYHALRVFGKATAHMSETAVDKQDDLTHLNAEIQAPTDPIVSNVPIDSKIDASRSLSRGGPSLDPQQCVDRPGNVSADGIWTLSRQDIEIIAIGSGVLGCGGGGNPQGAVHRLMTQMEKGNFPTVIAPSRLTEADKIVCSAFLGAPMVFTETLGSGEEINVALRAMEKHKSFKATGIVAYEAAGSNLIEPLVCAASTGIPFIDVDGMGRAFPEMQMCPCLYAEEGGKFVTTAVAGVRGEPTLFESHVSDVDKVIRVQVVDLHGAIAALCSAPFVKSQLLDPSVFVPHTISLAWRLGQAIHNARVRKQNPVDAAAQVGTGRVLLTGTVVDVEADPSASGFSAGVMYIVTDSNNQSTTTSSYSTDRSQLARVYYKNENLVCYDKGGVILSTTPDLIAVIDRDTAQPIFCDEYKYGLRVAVIVLACASVYRDPSHPVAPSVSPKSFGVDCDPVLLPHVRPAVVPVTDEFAGK